MLVSVSIIFLLYGWSITAPYIMLSSLLHLVFSFVFPYTHESKYAFYLKQKENFFKQHEKYGQIFTEFQVTLAFAFMIYSFFQMLSGSSFMALFVSFQFISLVIIFSHGVTNIRNIIARPSLPSDIKLLRPYYYSTRRFGAFSDAFFETVYPVCKTCIKISLAAYTGYYGGWMFWNGDQVYEPIHCKITSWHYNFPKDYEWTKTRHSDWVDFSTDPELSNLKHNCQVELFDLWQESKKSKLRADICILLDKQLVT
uniref:Uncharacterized protein n=1 Tax=Monodopsis sp. MarTras21 TaxID=1745953 RepID=A0A140F2Z3_9STRA|nr:hypothetical protein [Monodopsis sp. MarTras21]